MAHSLAKEVKMMSMKVVRLGYRIYLWRTLILAVPLSSNFGKGLSYDNRICSFPIKNAWHRKELENSGMNSSATKTRLVETTRQKKKKTIPRSRFLKS